MFFICRFIWNLIANMIDTVVFYSSLSITLLRIKIKSSKLWVRKKEIQHKKTIGSHSGIHLYKILIEFAAQNQNWLKICNNQHHSGLQKSMHKYFDRVVCFFLGFRHVWYWMWYCEYIFASVHMSESEHDAVDIFWLWYFVSFLNIFRCAIPSYVV